MATTDGRKRRTPVQTTRRNVVAMAGIFTGAALAGWLGWSKSAKAATPQCFLRGTRVWTPHGERRVEDLRINDLVVTSSGEPKPIQWVGRRRYERRCGQKWAQGIAPIRVAQSALEPNTPHRDLFLSQYHSLYLDGVLIPVVNLLNNVTIAKSSAEDLREIEYFHIKLARHSVIYAEGAACETLQAISANSFDNFEEYRRLYGEPTLSDEPACAPVLGYNGGRSMLRGRFRSAISPVIDVRSELEIVRDDLEERAATLSACDVLAKQKASHVAWLW